MRFPPLRLPSTSCLPCPLLRVSRVIPAKRKKKQKPRLMSAEAFEPHSDSHKLNAGICHGRDGI